MYLDLAFDLHTLTTSELPFIGVLGRALLETGAGDMDFVRLTQRVGQTTGGITTIPYGSSIANSAGCVANLIVKAKVMPDQASELISILQDILLASRIDDREQQPLADG